MLSGCWAWPEEDAARYRAAGYWRGEVLGDLLRSWARADPTRVAVVVGERRWTYAALDEAADRLAAGLHQRDVRPGDRVIVQLPNSAEFVTVSVALFRLGAIPVYTLPAHRRSEIVELSEQTRAVAYVIPDTAARFDYRDLARQVVGAVPSVRLVLVSGEPQEFTALADVAAEPGDLGRPDPADVAFFLLSGGTTGLPKLIPRTHDDYSYQIRTTAAEMGFDERGVYLVALPAAHNAALGCPGLLGALYVGGTAVLAATPSPDEVFGLIAREKVTLTTLMPAFLPLWMEMKELYDVDLSGLTIEVGGAPLDPAVGRRVDTTLGCTLTRWFGMAEGLLLFTRPGDAAETRASTEGYPMSADDEVRIVDPYDQPVAPGEVGELLARGPCVLRGYYRAEEYNARVFTNDGFLRTGDLVRLTADGMLTVAGRVRDVINRGGEKVAPEELESHLLTHPDVREVAVVGVADRVLGEKTCAVVVACPGSEPTLDSVRTLLTTRGLAGYKLPDRLELVDSLPRTSLGKVDRNTLRETVLLSRPSRARGRA